MNRQCFLEIDTNSFKKNIILLNKKIGNKKIIYVMKANAYGTYLNTRLDLIKDFNIIGVALVKEAIYLRQIGFKNEIIVLNQPYIEEINDIIDYNISIGICNKNFLKTLIKTNKSVKVHLELETGMGRTGIIDYELKDIINLIKACENIIVEGVYTHFADTQDISFTENQISTFRKNLNILKQNFDFKYIHCSASSGILNYDIEECNYVRLGIALYGYKPYKNFDVNLFPVAKLKAKISHIKEVESNFAVSYGRSYITNKKTKIATVGLGYADGIRRCLSNNCNVLINGKLCKIIGTVCMDSFMIDVTDIDVSIGDTIYIWDNDIITLDEIANKCNTINYEILSTISNRVSRIFIDN